MNSSSDKIKLRAEIISTLNKYIKDASADNTEISDAIAKFNEFEDKDFLAHMLFKESLSDNKDYADICANIAIEVIPLDIFQKNGMKILNDKKVPDNKKFYFISLLEHKGVKIDYENLSFYIQNPVQVANEGIKEFLSDSLSNPESRIDLLDFFKNISPNERLYLIKNLSNECEGDELANTLNTLARIYLSEEELDLVINSLLKIDSYYSYKAFEYIENHYELNTSNKIKVKTYLKNNALNYQDKGDSNLIKNSLPYQCYMSFVDGNSNLTLIFTRKYKNGFLSTFLVTANLNIGITSCIGFHHIKEDYFYKITKRLFTDSLPVKIDSYTLKGLLDYFYQLNLDNDYEIPYEYEIWKEFAEDIDFKEKDVLRFISLKLTPTTINKVKFEKISKSKLIENWYFKKNENKLAENVIKSIEKDKITDLKELDNLISEETKEYLTENKHFVNEIKTRFIFQSYIALLGGFNVSSSVLYGITQNSSYFKEIIVYFIYKSLYIYFNKSLSGKNKNVFEKEKKSNLTNTEIKKIINEIENKL